MAVLPGELIEPFEVLPIQNLTAQWTGEYRLATLPQILLDPVDQFEIGSVGENRPINVLEREYGGWLQWTFFNDFYERLYFIPNPLNLEWVTAETQGTLYVWNAYLRNIIVTEIEADNDEGVSIDLTAPRELFALGFYPILVTALPDGPPSINAQYKISIDGLPDGFFSVIGLRATLWEFPPNWDHGIDFSYSYRTEISTSRSGKEQRRSMRQTARTTMEFKSIATNEDYRTFIRTMQTRQSRSFVVPEYTRFVKLSEDMLPSSNVALVEEVPDWLAVGHTIVLVRHHQTEVLTVEDIEGNAIYFLNTPSKNWTMGAKICPALSGYLDNEISTEQHTTRTTSISVNFELPPAINPYPSPGEAPQMFHGREVFMKTPNWTNTPPVKFVAFRETVDYGFGRTANFNPIQYFDQHMDATYVGKTNAEAEEVRRFFDRMKAQRGEFYMPTWTEDIVPVGLMLENGNTMRIEGQTFANDYSGNTVRQAIAVFYHDDSVRLRKIESIYPTSDFEGEDTMLQFVEVWPDTRSADDVKMICWLPVWRFSTDTLNIQWITDGVAQFVLNFKTIEDEEGV